MGDSNKTSKSADDSERRQLLPKPLVVAPEEPLPPSNDNGSTLIIAFFLMLLFQLGNRIFGKLETYPMHNYPLFMSMMSCSIYIPICFAYIIPMVKYGDKITKEQLEIPKYKFAVMGMWDSVAGIMQTFAVNYITNASTIVLVQQSAIPISMAISRVTLDARYTTSQYLGAAIVLMGIFVVLLPSFTQPAPAAVVTADSAAPVESNVVQLLWILVLVLSCVPMCLSSVYKEKALGEMEIDVVYLNGWVAFFQFAFAVPLCIPSASVIHIPLSGILPNMVGGAKCWMGINSLPTDDCAWAPLFVSTYLFFNIVYNILIVVILKHGSANILWMASTVIVPLSNVAFSLSFMPNHKPLKQMDMVGLVVIMLGLVCYRFTPALIALWKRVRGIEDSDEEVETARAARVLGKEAERHQTKYMGLNQIEGIESLFDTRVWKEQRKGLFRSPQQIRGTLLTKLGIPPSPHISFTPTRGGRVKPSPSLAITKPIKSPFISGNRVPDRKYGTLGSTLLDNSRPGAVGLPQRPAEV